MPTLSCMELEMLIFGIIRYVFENHYFEGVWSFTYIPSIDVNGGTNATHAQTLKYYFKLKNIKF